MNAADGDPYPGSKAWGRLIGRRSSEVGGYRGWIMDAREGPASRTHVRSGRPAQATKWKWVQI